MSLPSEEAHSFIRPLRGKTVTLLVRGRDANVTTARTIMALLAAAGDPCAVLDLDALYASNSDILFGSLSDDFKRSTTISIPDPGISIETEIPELFATSHQVILVDSLNTLHHLLSADDSSTRSRKLSFAIASLSYLARTGEKAVFLTMYMREGFGRLRSGRSISSLSDVTASVETSGATTSFRCERGTAWVGGAFSIRAP